MNFQQLLAKMNELDQPAAPETAVVEAPVEECGEMPPAPMGNMGKPDTPPPSMSVNLNAQGLDNIEELLSLIKAVNPEMGKPEMPMGGPHIEIEPMDKPEGDMPKLGGLGNLDAGPLKMLPDFDADNDDKVGGEEGPEDTDGEEEKEDEAFGNSLDGSEPEVKGPEASIPDGNDINKPKTMVKHSYKQGDNPMAMEGNDLRASIRAELLRRLEEAKGAK